MAPTLSAEAWAQIRHDYEHTERPIPEICAEHGISSGTLRDRVRRWGWTRRREPIPREGPPPLPAPKIDPRPLPGPRAIDAEASPALGEDSPHPAAPPTPGGDPPAPEAAPGRTQTPPGWEGEEGVSAPRIAAAPAIAIGEDAVPVECDDSAIVPRLQSAVARVLPAIEATVARLAAGAAHPREMEQAGRALGALTRALRELSSLLSERQTPAPGDAAAGEPATDDDGPEDIVAFRLELARRMDAIVAARTANADGDA